MKAIFVLFLAFGLISAQTYCDSSSGDAGCNDITTDNARWCNTTHDNDSCLSLTGVSTLNVYLNPHEYCQGAFINTTGLSKGCIQFATPGCTLAAGVQCWGSSYDTATSTCLPERPAYNETPCTIDGDCVDGRYCHHYISKKRVIQSECMLPAAIGEVCGANGLPCEHGVCWNNVCRKYLKTGQRCTSAGYATCDPYSSVCNIGKCAKRLSLSDGSDCDTSLACQSYRCSSGHCIPSDKHTCYNNDDCFYSAPSEWSGSFPGYGLPAVCRKNQCYFPFLSAGKALFSCLHGGIFSDSKPQESIRDRLLAKCGSKYAAAICSVMCPHRVDLRFPMEDFFNLNMVNLTVNCNTKEISKMATNCAITPDTLYSNCDSFKNW